MDCINLFDFIPEDLLVQILNYYRYSEIPLVSELSSSFNKLVDKNLLINTIRLRIHQEFKFSLSLLKQYNMIQLIRIGTISKPQKIVSSGGQHSLALNADGQVYGFGCNYYGQLGLGDNKDREILTLIPSLTNIISISSAYYHSLALTADGHVYVFGHNNFGQLGLGDTNGRDRPELIPLLNNIIFYFNRR